MFLIINIIRVQIYNLLLSIQQYNIIFTKKTYGCHRFEEFTDVIALSDDIRRVFAITDVIPLRDDIRSL